MGLEEPVLTPVWSPVLTANNNNPEGCRHSMVPRDVWCAGLRCHRCVYCGVSEWRPADLKSVISVATVH